jgi:hypothetical protein
MSDKKTEALRIHTEACALAASEGCLCTGPKPRELCPVRSRDGFYACCRVAGHAGPVHVACAGALGPHGISSWTGGMVPERSVKRWKALKALRP